MKPIINKLFDVFGERKKDRRIEKIKKRVYEALSLPTIFLAGFIIRIVTSFAGWLRAILISWGVLDGVISNYMYKEEKFFPYQFLRYGRIIANLSGVFSPVIPLIWNISDGIYSMIIYEKAHVAENFSRLGRVINGALYVAFF
ncbi:MAG: hypothetical protein ACP5F8_02405 [Candidatus Aenigmatarchaeota archaeon]